jgi:lysophospholipase L1-like esterase
MKKKIVLSTIFLCMFGLNMFGQHVTYKSTDHYNEKVIEFENMRDIDSTDVVMLGNSLTEYAGDWNKLLKWRHIRNRGIAGDDAMGIYHRLNQVLSGKPKAIFLMVGINDLSHDLTPAQVAELCEKVIDKIHSDAPSCVLYVQSILPINETFHVWTKLEGKTDDVPVINNLLHRYCRYRGINFINLFPKFVRHGTNQLREDMSIDGLHLNAFGYKVWAFNLRKYLLQF